MSADDLSQNTVVEEYVDQGPDRVTQVLKWAILFVVVCIAVLAVYAVVAGVVMPPAPRTQAEALLNSGEAAVQKNPGNGKAWAQYARVLYLTGSKDEAWDALKRARKAVKDETILWVNVQEVDMLLTEGKDEDVLKKSKDYIQQDINFRGKANAELGAKGIKAPLEAIDNEPTIQMFVMRATAEGNLKKYKDAVRDLDNALVLDPQAADIIALRGWAKLNAKDKKGAKADFETALKFLPDNQSAQSGLEALKSK